jgi:hypothetical protein
LERQRGFEVGLIAGVGGWQLAEGGGDKERRWRRMAVIIIVPLSTLGVLHVWSPKGAARFFEMGFLGE